MQQPIPQPGDFIFFYGTLMQDFPIRDKLKVLGMLKWVGKAAVAATLYDLGDYPGIRLGGTGRVQGQLYRIIDVACVPVLDEYEDFFREQPEKSLYLRKQTVLLETKILAWVYEYHQPVREELRIKSGDWVAWQ